MREVTLSQILRYLLPIIVLAGGVAAAWGFATAQSVDEPYEFKLGPDITATAGEVVIKPGFKGVADDRFAFETYTNITREGITRKNGKSIDSFRRSENWTTGLTLITDEDPIEGTTDLQFAIQFDQLSFLLDVGKTQYSGRVSAAGAKFHEIAPNGERTEANNIPGWAGITARDLEATRKMQSGVSASAWANVTDSGKLYNPTYYAEFTSGDQTNYLGRLHDPIQLVMGLLPEFADDSALKLGEDITVRCRFPVGVVHGAWIEYDFTYKLNKLYGTMDEPTAARFTFTGVPVKRERSTTVDGLTTSFTAPDVKGGSLLYDLTKGVPAHITWEYGLKGKVTDSGTNLETDFEVEMNFSASLRTNASDAE